MGFFDDVDVSTVNPVENNVKQKDVQEAKDQVTEKRDASSTYEENEYSSSEIDLESQLGMALMEELMPKEEITEEFNNDVTNESLGLSENGLLPGENSSVFDECIVEDTSQNLHELFNKPLAIEKELQEENTDESLRDSVIIENKDKEAKDKISLLKKSKSDAIASSKTAPDKKKLKQADKDNSLSTIIGIGSKIEGNINAESAVFIYGTVKGDIFAKDNIIVHEGAKSGKLMSSASIMVYGTSYGEVNSSEYVGVEFGGKVINGHIRCNGDVGISEGSVVVGNIDSKKSVIIAGAVKGDIEAGKKVVLKSSAIIQGNIKSASIVIEDGAAIEGTCTQTTSRVNPADFFKNIETEE